MTTTFLVPKNNANSKLLGDISAAASSLTVQPGEGARFPSTFPFHISIDNEILSVTARSTDTMTVTRAQEGTSAAAHKAGTNVALNITAKALADIHTAVNTLESSSHARYTNSEAIAATQAIKLDDFTAPDDNTDLDASTSKHGLMPKADKVKLDGIDQYPGTGEQAFLDADHTKLDGIETAADVTDAANVGSSIHGATAKATPVDNDEVALIDSAASNVLKKSLWSVIKSTLKTYFDGIYATPANITGTKIDDLTAGDDNTDLNASTTRHGLCPKGANEGKFLKDDLTWGAPSVSGFATIASGTYTGDNTTNRAIAHGLGATPKIVMIIREGSPPWAGWIHASDTNTQKWPGYYGWSGDTTAMDSTDFHVSPGGGGLGNESSVVYYWIAIA